MVDANDKSSPTPSSHFVDSIPEDSVVFISQPRHFFTACWGGLMATRARKLGAKGIVIDGNFRDINEHRELEMPVCTAQLDEVIVPLTSYRCSLGQ